MVVISETSNDGSNGGDPNKKPKEEDNRNKKLKEKVVKVSLPIPNELILRCFLLVRRCHYPSLSLVCNSFLRLMPKLYDDRLRLGYTESVLYAYIVLLPSDENPSWYILHRKPYRNLPNTTSLRLCKIDILLLPPMLWGFAMVTIGSDIYVIGGRVGEERTSDMTLIDCKSLKYRSLPRMKVARCLAAACVIDGKIYVIGGCLTQSSDFIEVFDVKTQIWSGTVKPIEILPSVSRDFEAYAVIEEKIYLKGDHHCYVYEPKESKWMRLKFLELNLLFNESSCVIGDKLFLIHGGRDFFRDPIVVCDLKKKEIRPLKGLQGFPDNINMAASKMANFGGRLVILGCNQSPTLTRYEEKKEVWCVEIELEEREEGGEIWGKVESVAVLLTSPKYPSLEFLRTVTV